MFEYDIRFMQRCLDLAKLGERRTAPNPMVGCVIVHNGMIIGEGYHQKWGGPHAEVNAIASVKDKTVLTDSTIYVSLEPCAHYGKTPPCADLIVSYKIPRVVIGSVDPFAKVAGKGIRKLQESGCEVVCGALEKECKELNRRFFTFHALKRPFIILKWAQTADGFVDIDRNVHQFGEPTWITNEMARIAVHKQRSTEQAIFIGTETAYIDNPALTLRDWFGTQPLRIVADRKNRLPANRKLFDGTNTTLVLSTHDYSDERQCEVFRLNPEEDLIDEMLNEMYRKEVQSVIVEGGPKMLQSFIDRNLWDEAHVYIGQLAFGAGIKAPVFNASPICFDRFYNSELRVYRNNSIQ